MAASTSSSSLAAAFFHPHTHPEQRPGPSTHDPTNTPIYYHQNRPFPFPTADRPYQLPQQPHTHQIPAPQPQPQLQQLQQHNHIHFSSSQDGPFRVPLPPKTAFGLHHDAPITQPERQHLQPLDPSGRFGMSRSLSLNSVDLSYSQPIPHPNSISSGSGATSSTSPTAPFHSDFALTPASSSFPMDPDMSARFASYDLADASTASSSGSSSSSNGCSGAVPNIDQLLAISKAQADIAGDANLFACPHCDKRYTGKHARSIWRRHLQDKHNIPLSIQPRRTRWDGDANRPKNAEERRARMLESKRRWARKKRLQEKLGSAAAAAAAMRESEERADDADISSMSFDDSFASVADSSARPVLQPVAVAVAANGQQQSSVPSGSGSWISPARRAPSVGESSLFSSQERSKRPAPSAGGTDGADATPLTAFSSLYPTPPSATSAGAGAVAGLSLYSSPIRKAAAATGGVRMLSPSPTAAQRSAGNESFASSSASVSDYSLVDSHSGNTTADTSVSVSVCKKLPPPVGMPRKYDQKEAAIQLLALRSNSNSPTEAERRPAPASQAWDTPSKRHASPRRRSDPDPSTLMTPNPFSLDKHKISPFEGKRKLSFSHESPRPRLPPLASTPFELRSATKRPTAGAGAGTGVGVGATPLAGQFSSPQHLNLTESLGLAPHSVTRTLGLTPSIAGLAWPESVKRPFPFEMDDDDRALDLELDTPSKPRRRPRPLGLSLKANVSNLD